MTADRWQQIKALFYAASERAPAERAAFLDAACVGDEALRREVESLLATDAQAGSFLKHPVLAVDTPATETAREPTELSAGQIVDHYCIERRLGAGGMGVVYLARDTQLDRPVALKLLPLSLTQDAARVRRFQQEARAASALNHPNILTIYKVGQATLATTEIHYIAAEFVDGPTLREQGNAGGMSLGAALELLIQVASALAAAHAAGIVHRDIKPENLMLRRDGLVKVLDFGLAKLLEKDEGGRLKDEKTAAPHPSSFIPHPLTAPGVVMGTVSYMSPEQARGVEVDARSDLFSLGVVMYELLTGRAPFVGETTSDVLVALLSGEPRPLARYVAELPVALQEMVNRALAKPVEQRYQTARELGAELKRLKEELEFAVKLKGRAGSQDDILTLTVGATTAPAEQTTFATRQAAEPLTYATRRAVPVTTARFAAWRALLRRYGKGLAAAALALALGALVYWQWLAPRAVAIDSVAVLPFANVGSDQQMEYLPDGLTENLIDSLTRLPALRRVMSRSIVFTYKGREVDPREVGRALQVRAVVTGRVQRQGERLVISVELVDVGSGAQLWSERYEHPFDDLLIVQEQIAREITEALRLRLSGAEQRQIAKRYTQNTEAYQLYLIGRYHWNKRSPDGLRRSVEFFIQAAEKDPGYALALVGLADAYATLGTYHLKDPREVLPQARAAVAQALSIDENLAEAHATLGRLLTDYYWEWAQAEREFRRALDLNPNYANAHHWYSTLLAALGRFDEAIGAATRAAELDYHSPVTRTQLGIVFYWARRYDQALSVLQETLAREPNYLTARLYVGLCYLLQKRYTEALAEFHKGLAAAPNSSDFITLVGMGYGLSGQPEQARRYQRELNKLASRSYVPPSNHAGLAATLGELDAYFEWLEKCHEERSPTIRGMKTEPLNDIVRQDARFVAMLRRVGLAP